MTENLRNNVENEDESIVPNNDDVVTRANEAAARLEAANKVMAESIKRMEALRVQETLGGKTSVNVEKKEESPEDYAKKVLNGDL